MRAPKRRPAHVAKITTARAIPPFGCAGIGTNGPCAKPSHGQPFCVEQPTPSSGGEGRSRTMASDAFLPVAEYRVYLCDAASAIEPYLCAWSQIAAGHWIVRFRRHDGI